METPRPLEAFEKVKDQIGACGIWCGSCVMGNGSLMELSRSLRQLIVDYGLEAWGPKDVEYGELIKGLAALERMPICPGCWRRGGRDRCELRACARKKHVEHCGICREAATCAHANLLDHMRSGARKAGLFVRPGSPPDPTGPRSAPLSKTTAR